VYFDVREGGRAASADTRYYGTSFFKHKLAVYGIPSRRRSSNPNGGSKNSTKYQIELQNAASGGNGMVFSGIFDADCLVNLK
jgi:hypothetical protein